MKAFFPDFLWRGEQEIWHKQLPPAEPPQSCSSDFPAVSEVSLCSREPNKHLHRDGGSMTKRRTWDNVLLNVLTPGEQVSLQQSTVKSCNKPWDTEVWGPQGPFRDLLGCKIKIWEGESQVRQTPKETVKNNLFDKFPKWTILVKHRHKIKLTGTMEFWIQGKEFGVPIPGSHCWFLRSAWIHSKSTSRSSEIKSHPAKPHFHCGPRNSCVSKHHSPHHPHKW